MRARQNTLLCHSGDLIMTHLLSEQYNEWIDVFV